MTPEALPDPVAIAIAVAGLMRNLGIAYVIGGSFASSLHGEPRSTNDVDIVADLTPANAERLVSSFGSEYYISPSAVDEAIRSGGSFNVIHIASAVKVDIFVAGDDALDLERLRRRHLVKVSDSPDAELFVDTPEDTIIRKLEWFRRGGEASERQWRDVIAVMRLQGERLDRAHMLAWTARLGVSDLFARAETEAR